MKKVLCAALVPLASGGAPTFEFSSTDLTPGSWPPELDNVKGSWSGNINDGDMKLALSYDRKANKDFLKEATLSGSMAPVSYLLTQNFASGVSKLALSTKQAGATFKSVLSGKIDWSSAWLESCNVASVAVVKGAEVRRREGGSME